MKYYTIPPTQKLADHVRFFWVLEGEQTKDNPYKHHSIADGFAELIFHYKGTFDELILPNKVEKSSTSGIHAQSQ